MRQHDPETSSLCHAATCDRFLSSHLDALGVDPVTQSDRTIRGVLRGVPFRIAFICNGCPVPTPDLAEFKQVRPHGLKCPCGPPRPCKRAMCSVMPSLLVCVCDNIWGISVVLMVSHVGETYMCSQATGQCADGIHSSCSPGGSYNGLQQGLSRRLCLASQQVTHHNK